MKIETVLAKFNIKAVNYEPSNRGKPLLSAEEQLAMVGLNWHESPIGFSILFSQYLNDKYAAKFILSKILKKLSEITSKKRIKMSESVKNAIAIALVCEVSAPFGIKCGECNGTGVHVGKNRITRKCQSCTNGLIKWNINTRYATVYSTSFIAYDRFEKIYFVYLSLVKKLQDEYQKAENLLKKQFKLNCDYIIQS